MCPARAHLAIATLFAIALAGDPVASALAAPGDPCHLAGIPVADCDPRPQAYALTAGRIPLAHLAMVRQVGFTTKEHASAVWPEMLINLPETAAPRIKTLTHEVGHIVAATLDLYPGYKAEFWPRGKPLGRTSTYGATRPHEDFADCYAAVVHDSDACDSRRVAWLREHAFAGTQYARR